MGTVDDYLTGLEPAQAAAFARVRDLALEVVPGAEQGTSYGMAALLHRGRALLGFRAAQRHLSVFPCSAAVVEAVSDRLDGFVLSKGTIRFVVGHELPDDVVRDVVRLRAREIEG